MNPARRIRLALVTGLILANVLVLVLAATSLSVSRQHYVHRAEMLTQNVANALDQSLAGTIAKIDISLLAVVDELQGRLSLKNMDATSMNAFLLLQQQRTPEVSAFRVAGSDGRVIFGKGVNEAGPISLADRDYFLFLRDHPDAGPQVSKALFGRVSKDYFIGVTRAYRHPDGSFAGLVVATVPVDYFASMLSRFDLGPNGALVLRDADSGLIARVPPISDRPAGKVGSTAVSVEFRQLLDSGATTDTFFTATAADGFARISTFRRLETSHMLVIAAMAESDYLGGWSSERYRTISMGLGFLVLSLLLGAFLFRLIGQAESSERRVRESKSEELRFKDDFLSHVSHELRSPLTAIKQFTSILIRGLAGELNEEQRQFQAIVLKNVHQLQSMIDDLLEVTRLETGKTTIELTLVAVHSVAADAVETLAMTASGKGIAVSSELSVDLPPVYADPIRLLQVLIILLDNAVKFTPTGGSIRIRGRLAEEAGLLRLEVSDTGIGIAPELLEKLFERLFQAVEQNKSSRKGLGLGLFICKELVTRQGGTIWVESKVGSGSTFVLTLPLFSMSRLIAPLVRNGRWPAGSAALLTVHLRLPGEDAHSAQSNGGPPHEAHNLLQKCLLPDLDLLLPNRRSTTEGEFFFIVVFADEKGRSTLARRIHEQFQDSRVLNSGGRTLSLSYSLVPDFAREVGSSIEQATADMARHFEDAVRSQSLPNCKQAQPKTTGH